MSTLRPVVPSPEDSVGNILISASELETVVEAAMTNRTGRARMNAHESGDSAIHEVVIAFRGGSYVRPHRHTAKRESFHVISGLLTAIALDDDGQVIRRTPLGDRDSGRPFFLRNFNNDWHCFLIESAVAIVHETTNGPFSASESEFPTWAPDPEEQAAVDTFLRRIGE